MSFRRSIMMQQGGGGHGLPPEYQEVKYIESNGREFFDTGVIIYTDSIVYTDYQGLNNPSTINAQYGCGRPTNGERFAFGVFNGYGGMFRASIPMFQYNGAGLQNDRHKFLLNLKDNYGEADGVPLTRNSDAFYGTSPTTFQLFRRNQGAASDDVYLHYGRCWECYFGRNNIITNHFIPCVRKSDGIRGFFDIVAWVFKEITQV